jgi:hypothetical protein
MFSIDAIDNRVRALKVRYEARDGRMSDVYAVRRGDLAAIGAQYFPEGFDSSMVSNLIDVSAHDISEVLAPLPSFNCMPADMQSDKEVKAADMRTQIANHYVQASRLERQMYTGADWYLTYGFLPIAIEPDFEGNRPHIRIDNPVGSYVEYDKFGRVSAYVRRYTKTVAELVADFPQYERQILGLHVDAERADWGQKLELIRFEDKNQVALYVPARDNLVLIYGENPMGKVMVSVARRPDIDPDDPRGQFDDVIWVQLARARFAALHMEAVEKSVQAPMIVPQDVQNFAIGADAVIRTNNPAGVRRVGLELPTGALTQTQVLEAELRLGARYPEGRSGNIDASIITGQGVQALLGGFDTQVKTGQQVLAGVLEEALAMCFEMDEKLFPGKKEVSAVYHGAPKRFSYDPTKAIKGDYSIQVRYGLMSGLDPSRALIFALQALQAGLISKDWAIRELPWSMNVTEVQKMIEVERLRDSLSGAFGAAAQAIPAMVAQGQDVSKLISQFSEVIQLRKADVAIEDAVAQALAAPPAPEPPQVPPAAEMPAVEPMMQNAAPAPEAPAGEPSPQGQQPTPDIASILGAMMGGA